MAQAKVVLPKLSEREFTAQVIELAHYLGWRVAHFRPAQTAHGWRTPVQGDGKGFPDLVMVKGDRMIAAELKAESGKMADQQLEWLAAFDNVGAETAIWKPSHLEQIARVLGAG